MPDRLLSILLHWQNPTTSWIFFTVLFCSRDFMDKKDLFVVGLASGYGEAVDMVVALTEKVAAETGGADIKKYILDHR